MVQPIVFRSTHDLSARGSHLQFACFTAKWIVVAVGTTIADRPPHRSVRARSRVRLLLRMNGVEAVIGMGMQDAG